MSQINKSKHYLFLLYFNPSSGFILPPCWTSLLERRKVRTVTSQKSEQRQMSTGISDRATIASNPNSKHSVKMSGWLW
jgi:hypothetical protein